MKKILLALLTALFLVPMALSAKAAHPTPHKKKGPVGIAGWVVFYDDGTSVTRFKEHAAQMDRAYFCWYTLGADGMPVSTGDKGLTDAVKADVMAVAKNNKVETWSLVNNYDNATSDFSSKHVEATLYDKDLMAKHIKTLVDNAKKDGVEGIQIDYENMMGKDKEAFSTFMTSLGKACKKNHLLLGIALPAKTEPVGSYDDPQSKDFPVIGKACDEMAPMTYDQHWGSALPGCITSPEWTEMAVKYGVTTAKAGKFEVGYPGYGYDWVGNKGANMIWSQFKDTCAKYKLTPTRDTDYSRQLHIQYKDEKGDQHQAWIGDLVGLEVQANIAKRYKAYGLAMWYIGAEDQDFWTLMKKINSTKKETHFTDDMPELKIASDAASAGEGVQDLMTDKVGVSYAYAYPAPDSAITVVVKDGKRWVDATLKGDVWAGFGCGLNRTNLEPYRKTGALQLKVKGGQGGEAFTLGLVMDKGLDGMVSFQSTVNIADYMKVTKDWKLVTIPLADFPADGTKYDDASAKSLSGPMKWGRIIEMSAARGPGGDKPVGIMLSNVQVIPTYDPKTVQQEKSANK